MEVATLNLNIDNTQRGFRYRKGTADEAVIVQVLKNASYNFGALRRAPELSALYDRLTRTGKAPLIIDAGANIGAAAVYFASRFPKARVIAIEPERGNFELLTANTAGMPVECLHAAVSDAAINAIYQGMAQDTLPFIVKIDIEGGELFGANTEWVGRTPVIIVALHDSLIPGTANSRAFVDYIADCNRDFVYLHDTAFSIDRELS